jgi:transposase
MAEISASMVFDPSSFSSVVGVDIGKETCCFTILTPHKQVVNKASDFANTAAGFAHLEHRLEQLPGECAQIAIGLEATSRYGENLVQFLRAAGYQVCLLHPRQTHEFARATRTASQNGSLGCQHHCAGLTQWRGAHGLCPR